MPFRGVETSYIYDDYRFEVAFDSGAETSLDQRDIYWSMRDAGGKWADGEYLRSFYFEDANETQMRQFCRQFAADAAYRESCLNSTADWAQRDKLYRRNIAAEFGHDTDLIRALGEPINAYHFIKRHWAAVVALPEYQRIQALDSSFNPNMVDLDPEIEEAVYAFNRLEGVETRLSCQGVSGTVAYEGIEFLTVSPHNRFAYIAFSEIPSAIEAQLKALVPAAGHMRYLTTPWLTRKTLLQSTGDNHAFRRAALEVAQTLAARV